MQEVFLTTSTTQPVSDLSSFLNSNEALVIAGITLFASIIGALISQLFQFINTSHSERVRVSGLLAQDKYVFYKQLTNAIRQLNIIEKAAFIYQDIDFPKIKGNPLIIYHSIFNSWKEFNNFFDNLLKSSQSEGYLLSSPIYLLFMIIQEYWYIFRILAGGAYKCDDEDLWLFGLFCFHDIQNWYNLVEKECIKLLSKPSFHLSNRYTSRYNLLRKYYFEILDGTDLVDLRKRFLKLDSSQKDIEYPALFENWYDISIKAQEIRKQNQHSAEVEK